MCVYHYGCVKLLLHPRIIERAAEHIVCGMTGIFLGQRKTNTMHSVDERKKKHKRVCLRGSEPHKGLIKRPN